MASVDRLGWTAGLIASPWGARIGIRSNDEGLLERILRECIPAGWPVRRDGEPDADALYSLLVGAPTTAKGRRNYHLVYAAASRVARTLDLDEALEVLRTRLVADLGWQVKERMLLRAGVLVSGGRGLVVLGPEGPLVQALRSRRAVLHSHPFAVLDDEGRAHALGYEPAREEVLPASAFVFPKPVEQGPTRFRTVPTAEAAMALFGSTEQSALQPGRLLPLACRLAQDTPCLRVRYSDPEDAAERLLRRLRKG